MARSINPEDAQEIVRLILDLPLCTAIDRTINEDWVIHETSHLGRRQREVVSKSLFAALRAWHGDAEFIGRVNP